MALKFKNGAELAAALGYGKLYQDAVKDEQKANESSVTEQVKDMFGRMDSIFSRNIQERVD